MFIKSSWNPYRVAACCTQKPRKVASCGRSVRIFAEFRGNTLKVKTQRGIVKFEADYSAKIVSALVRGEKLIVELANGARFEYEIIGGKFKLVRCSDAARASVVDQDPVCAA